MRSIKTVSFNSNTEEDLWTYANSMINFSEYVKLKMREDLLKLDEPPAFKKCIICGSLNPTLKKTCSDECYKIHRLQLYAKADERKKLDPNYREKRREIERRSKMKKAQTKNH